MAFLGRHAHVPPDVFADMDADEADALERATSDLIEAELKGYVTIAQALLKGRVMLGG